MSVERGHSDRRRRGGVNMSGERHIDNEEGDGRKRKGGRQGEGTKTERGGLEIMRGKERETGGLPLSGNTRYNPPTQGMILLQIQR